MGLKREDVGANAHSQMRIDPILPQTKSTDIDMNCIVIAD
jgi:hypothetical protein